MSRQVTWFIKDGPNEKVVVVDVPHTEWQKNRDPISKVGQWEAFKTPGHAYSNGDARSHVGHELPLIKVEYRKDSERTQYRYTLPPHATDNHIASVIKQAAGHAVEPNPLRYKYDFQPDYREVRFSGEHVRPKQPDGATARDRR